MFRFVLSGSYDRSDGLSIRQREITRSGTGKTASEMKKQKNLHMQGWSLQGILYVQPIEPLLLHANVGKKTNLPHIGKLYGDSYGQNAPSKDLRSESAINYELGADFNYKFDELGTTQIGVTGFYNDLTDMMISTYVDKSECEAGRDGTATYCLQYQNADTGYIYGGEAYAKQGFLGDKLTLGATWSYTQRKSYNYDNNGNRTTTTEFVEHPRQNINLSALIAPRKEYDIALNGSVQTSRYARVNLGTSAAPIYDYVRIPTVVYFDVVANYYLKNNFKLSLGAYNMLDRNYNYSSSSTNASAGGLPGRRVFAGAKYRY